jgi:hypothetical protein
MKALLKGNSMTKDELKNKIEQCKIDEELIRIRRIKLEKELERTEVTYHCGQQFMINGKRSILAVVDDNNEGIKMCLINLSTGNRRSKPRTVANQNKVTKDEMNTLTTSKWELIE